MYSSHVEMKVKPGQLAAMKSHTKSIEAQIKAIGINQFLVLDQGNNSYLVLVIYNSAAEQEAAGPKAAELLGGYAEFLAAPVERKQVEVLFNF